MPGVMIERPKMTRAMYQALKRHIMRERERLKQAEQEQDEAAERIKKEREMKKKKEEEDSLTLEQTKEQISQFQAKLESMKKDKHELFNQLKKVLQEDENKKRAQMKEHNEMVAMHQYHAAMPIPAGHPGTMYLQSHMQPKPAIKYMSIPMHHHSGHGGHAAPHSSQGTGSSTSQTQPPQQQPQAGPSQPPTHHQSTAPVAPVRPTNQGIKRQRSPSPTPSTAPMYQHYSSSKYPPITSSAAYAGAQGIKQEPFTSQSEYHGPPSAKVTVVKSEPGIYQSQTTHVTYASQSGHSYPPAPQQAPSSGQSGPANSQERGQPSHGSSGPYQAQSSGAQGGGKYAPGQSAFQSYSTHYAHQQQKQITDPPQHYQGTPGGYQVTRMAQPGYIGSPHASGSSLNLQQQLEHANQKSGFAEDKFKLQAAQLRSGLAPISAQQHQPHMATPPQLPGQQQSAPAPSSQQPPKGGIVSGYPVRTQVSSSTYQPTSTQSAHSSPHSAAQAPPRHTYGTAPGSQRYY